MTSRLRCSSVVGASQILATSHIGDETVVIDPGGTNVSASGAFIQRKQVVDMTALKRSQGPKSHLTKVRRSDTTSSGKTVKPWFLIAKKTHKRLLTS